MNFPDLPHLLQLQRDLWQWPNSKAAVMVGAGFSLNADPEPGVRTRFSTWRQLVRSMFDELNPLGSGASPEDVAARDKRFDQSNTLRIASEYEAAFGRLKLNIAIRLNNSDSDYRPSDLHRMLSLVKTPSSIKTPSQVNIL